MRAGNWVIFFIFLVAATAGWNYAGHWLDNNLPNLDTYPLKVVAAMISGMLTILSIQFFIYNPYIFVGKAIDDANRSNQRHLLLSPAVGFLSLIVSIGALVVSIISLAFTVMHMK